MVATIIEASSWSRGCSRASNVGLTRGEVASMMANAQADAQK